MKRTLLALIFLTLSASAVLGQSEAGTAGQAGNLRGLIGVRLVVMFHGPTREEAFDNVERPGLLKMLEDDIKVKLQDAGIPFSPSKYTDDIGKAGNPRLVVLVKLDKFRNSVHPLVKLTQRVQLVRDPSIETDAVTWSAEGVGNTLETPMIQGLVAGAIDKFIRDYRSVNPRQSASSRKNDKH